MSQVARPARPAWLGGVEKRSGALFCVGIGEMIHVGYLGSDTSDPRTETKVADDYRHKPFQTKKYGLPERASVVMNDSSVVAGRKYSFNLPFFDCLINVFTVGWLLITMSISARVIWTVKMPLLVSGSTQ